jgi:hypothetical protein
MSTLTPEVWTAIGIIGAALLTGIVGKVWRPLRQTVAAIDVVAGRPERYPGDEETRPGLAKRLDDIDKAIRKTSENVTAMRSELDDVKQHVQKLEWEYPS